MKKKLLYPTLIFIATVVFIAAKILLNHAYWSLSWDEHSVDIAYPIFGIINDYPF